MVHTQGLLAELPRLLQERFRPRVVSLGDVQVAQVEQADGNVEVAGSLGFLLDVQGSQIGLFGLIVICEEAVKLAELVQPDRRLQMARAELFFCRFIPALMMVRTTRLEFPYSIKFCGG
jgi:hypothetical protein